MSTDQSDTPISMCEGILKRTHQYNSEHKIWPSENRVIEVMLERKLELVDAYSDLHSSLSDIPMALELFFDRFLSIAILWRPEQTAKMRNDRKRIDDLNLAISEMASEIAELMRKRDALHNESEFCSHTHYDICDVIEEAGEDNVLFGGWVKSELSALGRNFGLKYWPQLHEIMDVIAKDSREATAMPTDEVTAAATAGSRASRSDFFRALFQTFEESQKYGPPRLPKGFRLKDETLASLANCALDIGPDDLFDAQYVKRFRQRERDRKRTSLVTT